MRQRYAVREGGRLDRVLAIGFHGEVDPAQTPGRREAILADEAGHLLGLEPMGSDGSEPGTQAVWAQVGALIGADGPPGISTRFEPPFPAYLGHIAVVLGSMERAHLSTLSATTSHAEASQAGSVLQWLGGSSPTPPSGIMAQRRGEGVLWYCTVSDAFDLYQRICRVAEKEMVRASNDGNERALYETSWWLARAALDDSDRYFAAVGLERSNRSIADAYLKATFWRRPAEEIEAALRHARGVFDDRCMDAKRRLIATAMLERAMAPAPAPSSSGGVRIGETLIGSRLRMRKQYIVPQRRAA